MQRPYWTPKARADSWSPGGPHPSLLHPWRVTELPTTHIKVQITGGGGGFEGTSTDTARLPHILAFVGP